MRVVKKLKEYFDRYFVNRCVVYYYKKSLFGATDKTYVIKINKACEYEQLMKDNLNIDEGLSNVIKERFDNNEEMYYCTDGQAIISYGFKQNDISDFYAWEIAAKIGFVQKITMLYDFWVDSGYRGRGIYKSMLAKIQDDATDDEVLVIFAMDSNKSSRRGIEKSEFRYISEVSHFSPKVKQKL